MSCRRHITKRSAPRLRGAPIGTGPYMVEKFERNAFVRLKANGYWGGKPAFKTRDDQVRHRRRRPRGRRSNRASHVTLEVPYEEYDRLKATLTGIAEPDLRHRDDLPQRHRGDADPNVRKAAAHAIDKQTIIDRLLSGYGVKIDTLQTPEYLAYDAVDHRPYNPEKAVELLAASGYSVDNPVKFKIQTTKGFKPKDYEMVQAIVGLWRKVGIEAEIEVYEIAKHYELRAADQLAPAAFYNWGNSVGDPTTSTGFAMFGPSPHSVWDGEDLIGMIGPLWGEADEAKRIDGWKAVDKYIAENALVIPLLQYVQPILSAPGVVVTPHASGALLPHLMKRA
jgi:peptide/nickel transport system substrate-binding protein